LIFDDDGLGVDEQDREKVFKPFEKLDPKDDGFGLGLAIVRNIVQAHGGKIKLDKSPLGGLRVILTFPL
jgi:two-component system osmolarity sensor histidine kinase EnvZ